jgi:formylglycine-generating enzyme
VTTKAVALIVALASACGGKTNEHGPAVVPDSAAGAEVDPADVAAMDAPLPGAPASCAARKDGTDKCGPGHDCCAAMHIPGGSFLRGYDGATHTNRSYPATVSDFWLDEFEVTVGRFRAFVDAYPASKPMIGSGAHPRILNSGWQGSWPATTSKEALANALASGDCPSPIPRTWTNEVGPNEDKAINCVTWYELFAFCAWDGGRLPTQAEWNYAAAGGSAQRVYPWSVPATSADIDATRAVYTLDIKSYVPVATVGSKLAGASRWGPLDMAGNVWEVTLDFDDPNVPTPCLDCANLSMKFEGDGRAARGGGAISLANSLLVVGTLPQEPEKRDGAVGARCAR